MKENKAAKRKTIRCPGYKYSHVPTTILLGFILSVLTFAIEIHVNEAFIPSISLSSRINQFQSRKKVPLLRHTQEKNRHLIFVSRSRSRLFNSSSSNPSSSTRKQTGRPRGNNFNRNNNNNNHYVNPNDPLYKAKNLNSKIINCDTPSEVLSIFVSSGAARGTAGNNEMNTVNFSTSLHRIAKTCSMFRPRNYNNDGGSTGGAKTQNPPTQKQFRTMILTDPRFAILLCAVSEAFVEMKDVWNCRELSNIFWALAKIDFVPDSNTIPSTINKDSKSDKTNDNSADLALLVSAKQLRESVILAGKEQKNGNNAEYAELSRRWISQMRILAASLLDSIASHVQSKLILNFKSQEYANMIWALATVGRGDAELFDVLVKRLLIFLDKGEKSDRPHLVKPQELSNSIWAFATSGFSGEGKVSLLHYISECLTNQDKYPNYIDNFKPQELANTAWGVARLISKRSENEDFSPTTTSPKMNPLSSPDMSSTLFIEEEASTFKIIREIASAFLLRTHEFKPQEVSNTVWAMATVGFGDPESSHTRLPEDAVLLEQVLQKAAVDTLPRLRRFSPQELNCLGWAYARLGAERTPEIDMLFAGIGEEVQRRIRFFSPQDVGTTLWSFASMGYNELTDVFIAAASRVTIRDAHTFKPQELSNSVWALATVGMGPKNSHVFDTTFFPESKKMLMETVMHDNDVITECFAAAAIETLKRPESFKEQELKDVLWSFSKSGLRHPELFKNVAEHVLSESSNDSVEESRLMDFSPQGIGNFVWSYARQALLSNEPLNSEEDGDHSQQQTSISNSSGRLAIYETICLDMGEDLVTRLFATVAECSLKNEEKLKMFKPQDLSNTVWAFATLGLLHQEFFEAVASEVEQSVAYQTDPSIPQREKKKRDSFKGQEISNLIWAYATLNCHPKSGIVYTFAPYILQICSSAASKGSMYDEKSISEKFNRQELANLAWSCAVLQQYPEELIPMLYTGLIGEDDESMDRLAKLYNDDGLQKKSIMSLLYVQMALDLEAPHLKMKLPRTFLEMWNDQDNTNIGLEGNDNELMLLSTSKLQTSVSRAFEQIGFEHVEEYVLGSDVLQQHGIGVTSSAINFLSIDIANEDAQIGIEVDGPSHFINILDEPLSDVKTEEETETQRSRYGKVYFFNWNGERQVNGPTALKHRLLTHLGWRIIHLPFWEWNHLKDKQSQTAYCNELLEDASMIEG